MTKLNATRIKWLVRQVVKYGKRPSKVADVYGISSRRVRQLVQSFRKAGKMPTLNPTRRPKTVLSCEQCRMIDSAFEASRLSPRLLYFDLKSKGYTIPKNKMYEYLKNKGCIIDSPKKQKKRKRCRYEREHSGSLLHGDWHRTSENHPHVILWEDDASRRILSGGEFSSPNAENSIITFKQAQVEASKFNLLIKQVNTDRGSCFISNKETGTAQFQQYLQSQHIKHIPSRVNNPQTNGKLERLWLEYNKHRWRFNTLQEWIDWYNNRLHGALRLEWGETPNQAFIRKLPPETLIGLMFQ
ncbi:MAG: hypothetical protein AABX47_01700 [Nanoarchaeota archaeon]